MLQHRVDEVHYFQRYNFSTHEMKHFQIADLFGRRLAPDLDLTIEHVKASSDEAGRIRIHPVIHNGGRAEAKYVSCVCTVNGDSYEVANTAWSVLRVVNAPFAVTEEFTSCQFATGADDVVYPDVPTNTGHLEFRRVPGANEDPLALRFGLYAEGMAGKQMQFTIDPAVLAFLKR